MKQRMRLGTMRKNDGDGFHTRYSPSTSIPAIATPSEWTGLLPEDAAATGSGTRRSISALANHLHSQRSWLRFKAHDHTVRRRWAALESRDRVLEHCARLGTPAPPGLSPAQELALHQVYERLELVYDTADGLGKVSLHELGLCLTALGFSDHERSSILEEADRSGGGSKLAKLDGDARLSQEQFYHVFSHNAPKTTSTVGGRLESIGRVKTAAKYEAEEAELQQMFQRSPADARKHARRAEGHRARAEALACEAYPFAVVADAYRISDQVAAMNPEVRVATKLV